MKIARDLLACVSLLSQCSAACALLTGASASAGTVNKAVQRKIGEEYGDCLATMPRLRNKSIAYLLSGSLKDGTAMNGAKCFDRAVQHARLGPNDYFMMGPLERRSYVANGLVRSDFANGGPVNFATAPALDYSALQDLAYWSIPTNAGLTKDERKTAAAAAMTSWPVGECAARRLPDLVRRLALSAFGSADEAKLMRGLATTFAQCLPPSVTMRFPKDMLRDAAVLAYARLAYASRPIVAEKNN